MDQSSRTPKRLNTEMEPPSPENTSMLSLMSNLLSEKLDPLVEKVNKIDSLVEKVNNIDSYVKSAEQRIHDLEQKADMVDSLSEICRGSIKADHRSCEGGESLKGKFIQPRVPLKA